MNPVGDERLAAETRETQRGDFLSERESERGLVRQEEDFVPSRRVVVTATVAIVVSLLGVLVAGLLLRATTWEIRERAVTRALGSPVTSGGRTIAGIEQTPILVARDGLDLRDDERDELSRTHWLDRDAGVAAIPIERAMDMLEHSLEHSPDRTPGPPR
jgi:hypothetical protein